MSWFSDFVGDVWEGTGKALIRESARPLTDLMPKAPRMPQYNFASGDSATAAAAREYALAQQALATRKKAGLRSTLLTGPEGLTTPPEVFKTTLG